MSKDEVPIFNKTTGKKSSGKSASFLNQKKTFTTNRANSIPKSQDDIREPIESESISGHANKVQDESGDNNKSKRSSKIEIHSLSEFIEYAYIRKGQRISGTFNKAEKAICQDYLVSPEKMAKLLDYANSDVLLAVPKELLLISREIVGYPRVKSEIRSFVEKVLKRHFLFAEEELSLVLNNHPHAISPEDALNKLAKAELPKSENSTENSNTKSLNLEQLKINAVYCLATWLVETRSYSIEKIMQMIYSALWKSSIPESLDDTEKLKTLTEIDNIKSAGFIYSTLKKEAERNAALTEKALRAQESLAEELKTLNAEIENLKLIQSEKDSKIQRLTDALELEKNAHTHARIHLGDDKEQLRTRLLRRLKTEANLLQEGLHALRRDPPKIHVMDDHAERVLDGLFKEIKELESED
ncbi:hypothetical protein [Methylomonas sp. YC3]